MSLYDEFPSNSRSISSQQKGPPQSISKGRSKPLLHGDGNGRTVTASLAHELAAALMPEPTTASQLLADEFGIEFDDGAEEEGEGEEGENGGGEVAGAPPDVVSNDELEIDVPYWGGMNGGDTFYDPTVPHSPVVTRTIPQDPLVVLNQDLQTTDLFIEHLRRLDTDSSSSFSLSSIPSPPHNNIPSSGGELLLERLTSDFIRKMNDNTREREGQVRELREVEKEFRRIAGQPGGNDILGELDALDTIDGGFGGDVDSREKETRTEFGSGGRALNTVTEEEDHDTTADWELDPQRVLGEDDQLDHRDSYPRRQNSYSHARESSTTMLDSFSNNPTPSNAIAQLSNMRSLTQSLVQSLTTVVENTQVTAAATAEAGRKIRALKNKLGGWRAESESAERSMDRIEKWEAAGGINGVLDNGLFRTGAGTAGSGYRKGRRLQQVMQEELSAFELVLAEAGRKTQAIMAVS